MNGINKLGDIEHLYQRWGDIFYLDFNNSVFCKDEVDDSIIGSDVKPFYQGVSMANHKAALEEMLNNKIKRGYKDQDTIFHSDQGIYLTMPIKIIT